MVTTTLPLSEYSSVYRPAAGGGGTSSAGIAANSDAAKNPALPVIQTGVKKEDTSAEKLTFLDNFISFKKSAALKEERFLLIGLFNDVFKTFAKMLTGTFVTDVAKSLQKDANLTFEEVVYKTFIESGPSRIFNDLFITWFVRLFNGNHTFFGLFKLPFLAPEVSSQVPPRFLIPIMRSATKEHGINKKSQSKNSNPLEKGIAEAIENKNPLFMRFAQVTSGFFDEKIKPYCDKFLETCLGVESGEPVLDKEGNVVTKDGEAPNFDRKKGNVKFSNAKVNKSWLASIMVGSFIGQFFLPKFTMAAGFEKAKSPMRAALSVAFTSLCRLESTMIHNGFGMHSEGANFDKCFTTSVREKMLVPIAQYSADALGTLISHQTKLFNGSTVSTILRILMQMPCEFLSSPLINISAKDRVTPDWEFLAYKIWKPISNVLEAVTRPVMEAWCRGLGIFFGMYDPTIPNMYGVDLTDIKKKDFLKAEELSKQFNPNPLNVLGMLCYKSITIPKDIYLLLKQCFADSREDEAKTNKLVENKNKEIDLRVSAEKALQKLDFNGVKPETKNVELNERIVEIAKNGNKKDLLEFLTKPKIAGPTLKSIHVEEKSHAQAA